MNSFLKVLRDERNSSTAISQDVFEQPQKRTQTADFIFGLMNLIVKELRRIVLFKVAFFRLKSGPRRNVGYEVPKKQRHQAQT
jgi:hypothetical protein